MKYYDFAPTIYENFKSVFFYLYGKTENLEICISI